MKGEDPDVLSSDIASYSVPPDFDVAVNILQDPAEIVAVAPAWRELARRVPVPSPFLTPDWVLEWARVYVRSGSEGLRVITALAADGRLLGLLPTYRSRTACRRPQRTALRLLGTEPQAPDHLDALIEPGAERPALAALKGGVYAAASDCDAIELTNLGERSQLLAALRQSDTGTQRARARATCPYTTLPSTFDEFLSSCSSSHRYNFRRRRRNFENRLDGSFEVLREPAEVLAGLDLVVDLHQRRWGTGSNFMQAKSLEFHRILAPELAANGDCRIFVLRAEGQPVAALYGFRSQNQFFYYQAGFDPDYARHSVGLVLVGMIIEHCIEQGWVLFDFLRGPEEYKYRWTQSDRRTFDYQEPCNWRGRTHIARQDLVIAAKRRIKSMIGRGADS